MKRRPALLFIAPTLPAPAGNGLAMRAGVFLDALARDFRVTLLIVPVAAGSLGARVSRFVSARTCRVVTPALDGKLDALWDLCSRVLDHAARAAALAEYPRPALCRYATTPYLDELRAAVAGIRFEVVHVMRSYLAPYAAPFLSGDRFTSLDLDDDEAPTHRGLAALYERLGLPHEALIETAEAAKYERLETEWLPRFRQLLTCTADHAHRLAIACPDSRVAAVPNTIRLPPRWMLRFKSGQRILFVGNLSYLPNAAAIRGFVADVLPRLRSRFGGVVTLCIAGSAPGPDVTALQSLAGVELVVNPDDLAKHYARAKLAVIPLQAGGGTRIKLLEAFAYGVPVVATRVGAAGIAVENRTHLLLADSPATFADACAELLSDAQLGARLSANARRLVEERYAHRLGLQLIREQFSHARLPPAPRR